MSSVINGVCPPIYSTSRRVQLNGVEVGGSVSYIGSSLGSYLDVANAWASKNTFISNMFGFYGERMYEDADIFFKCNTTTSNSYGVYCNGSSSGEMTYHNTVNSGEGYVAQWWVK